MRKTGWALRIRALPILALSSAGHQPMQPRTGSLTITFNGEIYNFQELRDSSWKKEGVEFRSQTDTEVILRLFEKEGSGVCETVPGNVRLWNLGATPRRSFSSRATLLESSPSTTPRFPPSQAMGPAGMVFASELRAVGGIRLGGTDLDDEGTERDISKWVRP